MTRADPFAVVFGDLADELFPPIDEALQRSATDVDNRDAFLLVAPVGVALRRLVPETAPPETLSEHAALLHHAYRYWSAGKRRFTVDAARLERALRGQADGSHPGSEGQ